MSHSDTSGGALIELALAASTKGSLIMFTVNSFVSIMLFLLSQGFEVKDILSRGGWCET